MTFLQFAAKQVLQEAVYATAYSSVCSSVRHTPVLCQNEETQRGAVFVSGSPVSLVFLPRMIDGVRPVQVQFECKEVDPL